jgi:hypothetical protein
LKSFAMEAQRLNQLNDGDSACFYLRKAWLNLFALFYEISFSANHLIFL